MSHPTGGLRIARAATASLVHVPADVVRDASLSYAARGVLAFLHAQPDANARDLAEHGTESVDELEAVLDELRAAGWDL